MTNQSLPKKIKVSDNVLFQEINGECVLLNMESEQYFGLGAVGARIWELLGEEEGNTAKVLDQMQAEYEIDHETLKRDFTNLLEEMEREHLITIES